MMSWLQLALVALLLCVVAYSSRVVVQLVDEERRLFGELERVQVEQDEALAEQSRLLLERGAISAYQSVERVAMEDLEMVFPQSMEVVRR